MEGDVSAIMARPSNPNDSSEIRAEQDKWEAWNAQRGLSKTEAKRRYIELLIDTMHKYASASEEARELVSELEFVWEQIKNNSTTSSSGNGSSPQHQLGVPPLDRARAEDDEDVAARGETRCEK